MKTWMTITVALVLSVNSYNKADDSSTLPSAPMIKRIEPAIECGSPDTDPLTPDTPEDRLAWKYAYDKSGRLIQLEDPAGRKTTVSYDCDEQERVQTINRHQPDGSRVVLHFNEFGRCIEMLDPAGTVHYDYDGFGRLTSVRRDGSPAITYSYDTLDRLRSLAVADRWTVRYEYDFLGRLAKMKTPVGDVTYDYQNGQQMVVRTLPNGIRTVWQQESDGRLKSIIHVAANDEIICKFEYAYRADGLIFQLKEWTPAKQNRIEYQYDTIHRLAAVKDSSGAKAEYHYDRFGNRTRLLSPEPPSVAAAYDWAGRMTQYNGQPCTHDRMGNLTSYTTAGGQRTFAFDASGRLHSARGNSLQVTYQYDGSDYLVARQTGGKTTTFVPDPLSDVWRPLLASTSDGRATFYVWDGQSLLLAIDGDGSKFFLHDYMSSVRFATDKKGDVIERFDYTPFGLPRDDTGEAGLRPGFAGLFYDSQASLCLTRLRAYDPTLGRFLQPEPPTHIPSASQKHLVAYDYCGGDPVNFVDIDGDEPRWVWGSQNMAWQVVHHIGYLFDASYAKKWYAEESRLAIAHAGGMGIAASLTADVCDIAGGLIPGRPANQGQGYGQVMWSVATLGGGEILTGLGAGRTFVSSLVDSAEGNRGGAALDILSLGGAAAGLRARICCNRGICQNANLFFRLSKNQLSS